MRGKKHRSFWRAQHGVAVTEFALVLPLLLILFYGLVEITRFILIAQKVEKLAHTAADVVAQSSVVRTSELNQLLAASSDIMQPFAVGTSGTIIVSSLYRAAGSANAAVNWRYQGGGTLSATSRLGDVGALPQMPESFSFDERENVIVAEVFYRFSPLISNRFFGTITIYRYAFYRPRFGSLTVAPS